MLAGAHDFRTKGVGPGKRFLVSVGEVVDFVGRFTLREAVLSLPVVLDIPAGALDKMLG